LTASVTPIAQEEIQRKLLLERRRTTQLRKQKTNAETTITTIRRRRLTLVALLNADINNERPLASGTLNDG
jgi:hypothetical protein